MKKCQQSIHCLKIYSAQKAFETRRVAGADRNYKKMKKNRLIQFSDKGQALTSCFIFLCLLRQAGL